MKRVKFYSTAAELQVYLSTFCVAELLKEYHYPHSNTYKFVIDCINSQLLFALAKYQSKGFYFFISPYGDSDILLSIDTPLN